MLPATPFVLLEPRSSSQLVSLSLFLVGSLGIVSPRLRPLVWLHLAGVGMALLAHPLTFPFGRDGSLVVIATHFSLAIFLCTSLRPEPKLAIAASLLGLLAAETILSSFKERSLRGRPGLLDYGDVMGPYGPGGFLKPNLDVRVVGPQGKDVAFVTNALGFRNRSPLAVPKREGTQRVFLVGDSFVAGYRTDQEETFGRALERELAGRTGRAFEVMIAGAGHPGAARELVEEHLLGMEPDHVVVGVTLGNDLAQAWAESRRLPATVLSGPLLPGDAYEATELALLPVRLDRTLRAFRLYRRLSTLWRRDVIEPWFGDYPGHVHLFDPGHSLGLFYGRRQWPLAEAAFDSLFAEMDALMRSAQARRTPVLYVLLPQRFQVDAKEWKATTFRYGLDPAAFDLDRPNRLILEHCAAADLRCLDLLPAFRPACGAGSCYQELGDMHWNPRGQAIGAKEVASSLLDGGDGRRTAASAPGTGEAQERAGVVR